MRDDLWPHSFQSLSSPLFLKILRFFSGNLDKQTSVGNTVLHYCSMYGKPECLKLLLRSKPTVDIGECGRSQTLHGPETAYASYFMFCFQYPRQLTDFVLPLFQLTRMEKLPWI